MVRKHMMMYLSLVVLLVAMLVFAMSFKKKERHEVKQLTVYGYMGCPFTVKQLNLLKENNISHRFVATDNANGAAEFQKVMKGERSGVPVTINHETGKMSKGFTDLKHL